jgi:molecular chaperone HtpG
MKEGQSNIYDITGDSTAVVSSWPHPKVPWVKSFEVMHVVGPVDEYAMQQPEECDVTQQMQEKEENLAEDFTNLNKPGTESDRGAVRTDHWIFEDRPGGPG